MFASIGSSLDAISLKEAKLDVKYMEQILRTSAYGCGANELAIGPSLAHSKVDQPLGFKITNLENKIPFLTCYHTTRDSITSAGFLGRSPEDYEITPDMKLVKPLVFLQLSVDMHWTISLIGDMLLCGKDIAKSIKVWNDPKIQRTRYRSTTTSNGRIPITRECLHKMFKLENLRKTHAETSPKQMESPQNILSDKDIRTHLEAKQIESVYNRIFIQFNVDHRDV